MLTILKSRENRTVFLSSLSRETLANAVRGVAPDDATRSALLDSHAALHAKPQTVESLEWSEIVQRGLGSADVKRVAVNGAWVGLIVIPSERGGAKPHDIALACLSEWFGSASDGVRLIVGPALSQYTQPVPDWILGGKGKGGKSGKSVDPLAAFSDGEPDKPDTDDAFNANFGS